MSRSRYILVSSSDVTLRPWISLERWVKGRNARSSGSEGTLGISILLILMDLFLPPTSGMAFLGG